MRLAGIEPSSQPCLYIYTSKSRLYQTHVVHGWVTLGPHPFPNKFVISIALPRVVGVANADKLVVACSQIHGSEGPVELDCSEVRFFDPFGMAMLASALETIDPSRKISMPWLSPSTASYLERMDFFKKIEVDSVCLPQDRVRRDQRSNLLEIQRIGGPERSEEIAEQLSSSIATKIIGRPPKPSTFHDTDAEYESYHVPLRYALSELLENALTHARRDGRRDAAVWIASQYFQYPPRVQIAVIDNGCGFLATLRHHEELRDKTHAGAILTALRPKISCNRDMGPFNESVNEGVGLTTTVKISKATGGTLHILSGDAMVFEGGDQKRSDRASALPAHWNGVAISATFVPNALAGIRVSDHLPPIETKNTVIQTPVALRFDD